MVMAMPERKWNATCCTFAFIELFERTYIYLVFEWNRYGRIHEYIYLTSHADMVFECFSYNVCIGEMRLEWVLM